MVTPISEIPMADLPTDLRQAIEFHGHFCPGLSIGYRAARIGLDRLRAERAEDEELVAIVENDTCAADAVQVLTGCTFGKGNLVFRDWGKMVFTFALRPSGRFVRASLKPSRRRPADRSAAIDFLLSESDEDLFDINQGVMDIPAKARHFASAPCDGCGEPTMETRLHARAGKRLCPACLAEQTGAEPPADDGASHAEKAQ